MKLQFLALAAALTILVPQDEPLDNPQEEPTLPSVGEVAPADVAHVVAEETLEDRRRFDQVTICVDDGVPDRPSQACRVSVAATVGRHGYRASASLSTSSSSWW